MNQWIFGFFITFSVLPLFAGVSAQRPPGVSWRQMAQLMEPKVTSAESQTSIDVAQELPQLSLDSVVRWKNHEQIQKGFQMVRDLRFLQEPFSPQTLRRSTWLYPDDGCYARAALMAENLSQRGYSVPTKIFVYGDLVAKTENAPGGVVSWWYHVALIVSDGKERYVLDPSLEPRHPLELQKWLEKMGDPRQMKISLCESPSYIPYSPCHFVSSDEDDAARDDQLLFLPLERLRILDLGRNADEELGDSPPWVL